MAAVELDKKLYDFNLDVRQKTVKDLAEQVKIGQIIPEKDTPAFNLHCHTFFSFNAYGYSPSGLAWLARRQGFKLVGMVDFDVLDGVDEFLQACENAVVRGSAGVEMRVYVPEFADREINSPGEPGVLYTMGIGFTSSRAPGGADYLLADMRQRAETRNRAMVERINQYLGTVCVDYEKDVLPLTPAGNATERHILLAYTQVVARAFADPAPFWAEKLKLPLAEVAAQLGSPVKFQNTVRSKLMKRGGPGYAQPGPDTFPTLDEANRMIIACGALPCVAWLDGTSAGEQALEELLTLNIAKGAAALNIVPDRNWNISDPESKRIKLEKLYQVVAAAQKFDLPLNVGTEMNAPGQKLVDDFDVPELAPVRQAFLDGAYFIYGHTLMQRALGLGYQSEWAKAHLPSRKARNEFYTGIGRQVSPGREGLAMIKRLDAKALPADFLKLYD